MADPHVITALVMRRAELAGQIEATHEALRRWFWTLRTWTRQSSNSTPAIRLEAIPPNRGLVP
jgi:hypothetical protein